MRNGWAIALTLLPALAAADEVVLRSGGRLSGVVVEDSPARVVLETGPGRVTLARSRVLRVVSSASALETYRARAAQAGGSAASWLELGRWAHGQGLLTQANQAFERVVLLDPENAEAHLALGHIRVAGRWLVEDEAYAARGYVRFEGRWMRPVERDTLLAERQAAAAARVAEVEADARVREAEARARAAEADARAAEAAAAATPQAVDQGIPLYPPVVGGYGGVIGGHGGYGYPVPPPPVVVVVKPPSKPRPPARPPVGTYAPPDRPRPASERARRHHRP